MGARAHYRGVWWIMTLAMVVSLAACGTGTDGPSAGAHGTSSASATATARPVPKLDWRKVSLPAGVGPTFNTPVDAGLIEPVASPVNGRNAWLCVPSGGTSFSVWFTSDAGATWQYLNGFQEATPEPITGCSVAPDQGAANSVAVNVGWGSGNGPTVSNGSISFYSIDSGVHWTALPQNQWIDRVITVGGTTYAAMIDTVNQSTKLVSSEDHLVTWRGISMPGQSTRTQFQFWAASTPGELLWADMNGGGALYTDNGGAGGTWQAVTPPKPGEHVEVMTALWQPDHAVGQPANGWLICGYLQTATSRVPTENLCTSDRGTTWTAYPPLQNTWECGHCAQSGGPSSGVAPCLASTLDPNGALYAVCGNDPQDSGTPPTPWTISRAAPGGTTWVTVGQSPSQSITLTKTGRVWCADSVAHVTYVLDQLP